MRIRESITRRLPLKVPVSPTFSGLRIADTERVPDVLRGQVIPWMQVCGLHDRTACFLDERDEPVTHEGRRVNGVFADGRQTSVARRLLDREIFRRFDSGELELHYTLKPRRSSPWWIVAAAVFFSALLLPLALEGAVNLIVYFEGLEDFEPLSVRIMLALAGIAFALVWPAMFITFVFAVRAENRLRPREVHATTRGVIATLPKRRVDRGWRDLERVDPGQLTFNDRARMSLPRDERFRALGRVLRRHVVRRPDRSLASLWLRIAIGSAVLLLLAATPIVVLMRAGYLDQTDAIRLASGLALMIGMFLIPFGALSLLVARADAKARRRSRSLPEAR